MNKLLTTPIDILIYVSRMNDKLNLEIKNNLIKIGNKSWDCTYTPMQDGALDLIAHIISKSCSEDE